jgi:hypothetical protein
MKRTHRILVAHALAMLACAHAAHAQTLYGIRWDDGVLFSISAADASSMIIGTTGVQGLVDVVLAGDGFLYAVSAGTASTRHYQAWFRNAATFCTTQPFNLTNGVTISWST